MGSSTPSAPINSSRGAADTTAGRIYISNPSVEVRVPVGDLVSPPQSCSHYTTWGKIYPVAEKVSGGLKIMRRRNNYPGRSQVGPKIEKKSQNCCTVPKIPHSKSSYIEPNYTLSLYIEPNYTLSL